MTELEHGPICARTRCTGFQPGHELARRHGAMPRSVLKLKPRATEIAAVIADVIPARDGAYAPAR